MKKTINKQFGVKTAVCLFGAILFLILSGCSGPFSGERKTATLTINLGGGGRAVFDPSDLAQFSCVVILTGPSTIEVGPTEPGTQTLSISVAPGRWDITVTAYNSDEEVFAEGSKSVDLRSGQSSPVTITMEPAFPIKYDINGGTGTTPKTQIVREGKTVTLASENGFSKTGFVFGGWKEEPSNAPIYAAGQTIQPGGYMYLYAVWN